ncbi:MAG: YlxR family protein [Anaerolineae bacterium]|nr:YlxR family protein [Anaerolineae bacterium]
MRRKHVPLRTCIACQLKRPKRELIRIVRTPEGTIGIDPKGKQAGRGAYLCPRRGCWQAALQRGTLGRALQGPITAEELAALQALAVSLPVEETVEKTEAVSLEGGID